MVRGHCPARRGHEPEVELRLDPEEAHPSLKGSGHFRLSLAAWLCTSGYRSTPEERLSVDHF